MEFNTPVWKSNGNRYSVYLIFMEIDTPHARYMEFYAPRININGFRYSF